MDDLPDGFAVTPREVAEFVEGLWSGWFDDANDGDDVHNYTDAVMEVTTDGGVVELFTQVQVHVRYVSEDESDGTEEVREISDECPTTFEIQVTAAMSAHEGAVDDVWAATLSAEATDADLPGGASITGGVPSDELQGSAEPPWDPADWDSTELLLEAHTGAAMSGKLEWYSLAEHPADRSVQSERFGTFSLDR